MLRYVTLRYITYIHTHMCVWAYVGIHLSVHLYIYLRIYLLRYEISNPCLLDLICVHHTLPTAPKDLCDIKGSPGTIIIIGLKLCHQATVVKPCKANKQLAVTSSNYHVGMILPPI